jgi:hypothetical protein
VIIFRGREVYKINYQRKSLIRRGENFFFFNKDRNPRNKQIRLSCETKVKRGKRK